MRNDAEDNVQPICKECAQKRAEAVDIKSIRIGDFIKKGFPTEKRLFPGGGKEYMWVEVTEVCDDHFKGFLSNEPRFTTMIELGDLVVVTFKEVNDHNPMGGSRFQH